MHKLTRKLFAAALLIASAAIPALAAAPALGWGITLSAGPTFYEAQVGLHSEVGAVTSIGALAGADSWLGDLVVEASIFFDGIAGDALQIFLVGPSLGVGYRIELARLIQNLPWFLQVRFLPRVDFGLAYESFYRSQRPVLEGPAFLLSPALSADLSLPFLPALSLGFDLGYHAYLSASPLQSFHIGFIASWTL
jgi:hypothetical protein